MTDQIEARGTPGAKGQTTERQVDPMRSLRQAKPAVTACGNGQRGSEQPSPPVYRWLLKGTSIYFIQFRRLPKAEIQGKPEVLFSSDQKRPC
jgi:hypothetical protein